MTRGMARWTSALLAAGMATGCSMCGPKIEKPPPPPVYSLCLETSPRLNWYSDGSGPSAHTLYVKIFQLSSVEAFNNTDATRLVSSELPLQGAEGPPTLRTLHPGSRATVPISQQPNARWLGIVAGYYRLDGTAKASRVLLGTTDDADAEKEAADRCVFFDANQIADAVKPDAADEKAKKK